jgi:TPR repeat protein
MQIPADIASLQGSVDNGKLQWSSTTLSLDDADNLRIAETQKFHRTSAREVRDVNCENANPAHIGGEEAFYRSNAYFELKDLATANCWLRIGAAQGNARAQGAYAYALLHGRGIQQDIREATVWAEKGAAQGEPYSEFNLATIYSMQPFGTGMPEAQELLQKYKQHDPARPYLEEFWQPPALPIFLEDKPFTFDLSGEWQLTFPPEAPRHPRVSVVVIHKAGNVQIIVGDPNIYYPLGESMFSGTYDGQHLVGEVMDAPAHSGNGYRGYAWTRGEIHIVDANNLVLPRNIKMKRTDAELGANKACDTAKYAQLNTARAFEYGAKGIEIGNFGNGACWLYVSASQGHSEAQMDLGLALHFGKGVKQDDAQSFQWFKRSAEQGWVLAERALAQCYELGVGTPKNQGLAKSWFDKSAHQATQTGQIEKEKQDAQRFVTALGGILSGSGVSHDDRVAGYRSRGASSSDAEKSARQDESEAAFMNSLMNSYQPPPMPPK